MTTRYPHGPLLDFATRLFAAAGAPEEKAAAIAAILVEGDLLGHVTHGLNLVPFYLREIESGAMTVEGDVEFVADRGAVLVLNGRRLPGPFVMLRTLDILLDRAETHGVATASIAESHHIGCLSAYLTRATERGSMAIIASSDPSVATVAPFGGVEPVYSPNPLAIGIPTSGAPMLIDTSASITTNNRAARATRGGERLPGQWFLTAGGEATDDPTALADGGSILPVGGLEYGHKGFGLGLLIEALTQGLSGHGRADGPNRFGASLFLQVIATGSFAGRGPFERQMDHLAEACRASRPRRADRPVRIPGERAVASRTSMMRDGVALDAGIVENLTAAAQRYALALPRPME
ncbi:Ldh family oxidoreductase [Shinella pollutisoli]|uniref:Ldh family oxidoreductase n=1 Tax=Shinella pollutisoli TaxID=2250594 RepID=A0ABV7DGF3_9HYPH|nr:Ldh family oxidoreductase [Shinella pollutisoli]